MFIALGVAWVLAVVGGLSVLWSYENAAGVVAAAPARWPTLAHVPAPRHRPTLIMLVHPQCVCSRASVAELARLMARAYGQVDAHVLFVAPAGMSDTWVESELWRAAAAIPGVHVIRDEDGAEARRFGVATSGQALLYDADGRLRFSGGITASRGFEGDNAGRLALASLLSEGHADSDSTSVFGCALFTPVERAAPR